mgnify:CR=1 FL=1
MRAALLALALAAGAAAADPAAEDPAELARAWAAAEVWLPSAEGPRQATVEALAAWPEGAARGVVVFAHGCDGLGRIAPRIGRFLAEAGHVVVAPDGFARETKPRSCDPARLRGGLHRTVLGWRQAELAHAVRQVRALPAFTEAPLAVMGHSEGAIAVATAALPPVDAREIEGWTCHAGWPEYRGLAAPAEEPVPSLVGEADPCFAAPVLRGDCGRFMDGNDVSVVYRAPDYLHARHWLSFDDGVRGVILAFLAAAFEARGAGAPAER